ncbi:MAG TPA: hypothetical protein VD905_15590 [Flavobacteriales bacterium]|nr:hypothetical protein [Flavobacteriales bacterium]
MTTENNPFVAVKKKHIQLLLDYCLENKIEFTVTPKNSEEFKVIFGLKDFNSAIALGMCLRELKIEFNAIEATPVAAIKAKKTTSNGASKEVEKANLNGSLGETTNSLSFDLDAMN